WGNDLRDNDGDGDVDERDERTRDGAHHGETYRRFWVRRRTRPYEAGWFFDDDPDGPEGPALAPGRHNIFVHGDREIGGRFRYAICADIVSEAYHDAGVMSALRSTERILAVFRRRGYVWQRSTGFPN